ncbi:uncharacterized protein SONE68_0028 [Lacticaseibacillus paracasei]|nr:uncharacterized protein SONE68_0028 [Lacticaseibacillus paracasei]GEK40972.1 hypothetical protein LCA02_26620 [Lacticaseibacillus casei]
MFDRIPCDFFFWHLRRFISDYFACSRHPLAITRDITGIAIVKIETTRSTKSRLLLIIYLS